MDRRAGLNVPAILEITHDTLLVVAARVQTLDFNLFFYIKYTLIYVAKMLIKQNNIVF